MTSCWLLDGPGLCDRKDGEDLSFAANAHLFEWPAALVSAESGVVMTADMDQPFRDVGYKQWKNKRARHEPQQIPVPIVSGDPSDFSVIDRLRAAVQQPESAPIYGFSRPSQSSAFRLAQQLPDVSNPWIDKLGLNSFKSLPERSDKAPTQYETLGTLWLLNSISEDFLSLAMFNLDIVELIGPKGGAFALRAALQNQGVTPESFDNTVRRYQSRVIPQVSQAMDSRMTVVEGNIRQWLAAGRKAVRLPDGTVDETLSRVNAITALHGAQRLAHIGLRMDGFAWAANDTLNCLINPGQ
ncbi:hypothetical protein [Leptothoe spongobia]|uniref:Uncharacterized protein n=1 Tax=Leptothoe spongobia TAU-MAC 1115 TaxID=1967444 RepID=A0A947GJ69_9CYAN|nr:hypothetical protein [Leptothoe spongobia]MBT9316314.1 hypothetical protein [Leptothoe spongobia TAU-MAC 1115]